MIAHQTQDLKLYGSWFTQGQSKKRALSLGKKWVMNNLGCLAQLIDRFNNRHPTSCGSNECWMDSGVSLFTMEPNI